MSRVGATPGFAVMCPAMHTTYVGAGRRWFCAAAEDKADVATLLGEPPAHVKALVEEVLALNTLEAEQLQLHLQDVLKIPDAALSGNFGGGGSGGGGGGGASVEAEVVEEKTSFDLKMKAYDAKSKIKIIKEVRSITGLGLKEAKEMVEGVPVVVKAGLSKDEAEELLKKLVDLGADAELS